MNGERIKSWLQRPKVWRSVCFVLSIIGLFCFALSSIFSDIFGKWKWWKIFLYILFTSVISFAVFFSKAWPPSASLSLEARVGFLILMVTSLYSFYFDKLVKGKPDAYSLASFAAFSVMSIGLSRLIHFEFGVDLLYYFCGLLTVQLMKIKFWLVIVGGSFSYSLIKLCYSPLINNRDIVLPIVSQGIISTTSNAISQADVSLQNEDVALLVIQVDSDSQESDLERKWALLQEQLLSIFDKLISDRRFFKYYERTARAIRFDSSLEDKYNDDSIRQLMDCIKELEDSDSQDSDLERKWALLKRQLLSTFDHFESDEKFERKWALLQNQLSSSFEHFKSDEKFARFLKFEFSQEDKLDDDSIRLQLMDCIKELEKENETLIPMVCSRVEKYLKAIVDSEHTQVYPDVNLLKDALPSETITRLQTNVMQMLEAGLGMECCHVYSNWRREFIEHCLTALGLQLQLQALNIENWIKICKAAANILFPTEWILCHGVFLGLFEIVDVSFTMVCTKLTIPLLSFVDIILSSGSYFPNQLFSSSVPKMRESLHELTQVFELFGFYGRFDPLLRHEADEVLKIFNILIELENIIDRNTAQATVSGGGVHPITQNVMQNIHGLHASKSSFIWQAIKDYNFVVLNRDDRVMEWLESNLEAMSRDYDSALGYVFMMNNLHYIGHETSKLSIRLEEDWFQKNTAKVDQNLQLYLSSSWNQILDFLKLDINDSLSLPCVPDDTVAESMKDKLNLFNLHFEEICNDQSTWIVYDKKLRERIIKSIEKVLFPAYGSFIERFHNVFGNHAYEYIEHGIKDIVDRLSFLFLVDE